MKEPRTTVDWRNIMNADELDVTVSARPKPGLLIQAEQVPGARRLITVRSWRPFRNCYLWELRIVIRIRIGSLKSKFSPPTPSLASMYWLGNFAQHSRAR